MAGERRSAHGIRQRGGVRKPPGTNRYLQAAGATEARTGDGQEAMALANAQRAADGGKPTIFGLEQLRDDLLIALWITQLGLANR